MSTSPRPLPQGNRLGTGLILLLALLTALDAMAIDLYLPGMPFMATDLGVGAGRIQQTLSIFLIGLAVGQCIYGPLLDCYGRRLPLLLGVVVFVAGSILAATAPTIEWLMLARLLQALGAAAGLVVPRAMVADLCTMTEAARAFSLLMQVMMIAPIAAPLLGGYLLGHGSWRFLFWVLAFMGGVGLLWAWRSLPESLPVAARVPLDWRSIWRGYTRQLCHAVFMGYTLASGFVLGSLFAYISGSAFIFTQYYALTPVQFSYLFAANSLCIVAGGQISNWLLRRSSVQRVMGVGMLLHGVAALALWLVVAQGQASVWSYAGLLALAVGALGLVFGNLTALTMGHASGQAGVASSLMGALQYAISAVIGYLLSLAASGPVALPMGMALCAAGAVLASLYAQWRARIAAAPA
ncbi:MFS transporter, DHA1 family, bicyclomycin/chloramphenicol resistance protein [Lampropedia hyalina DSM 16112]|jgi:DHA1 family bicyclomycin/chloramphenicol resistance-like MFS transporter|uniref:Bcr/CflA family efflux transporter n=1 Tax=Lampropedia hyalina DSM 16112 TaxID=1122156 RepID=A0A1M5E8X8_9BURK|nr:multidrug effflux MFS transporter [Lampropedia hyalina]SHF75594.1 MFS transporter, DHA1 family, bicyclomycin/chloramphenicol resistance protein [Lampropedia hyalina DSM 16112]